jgi:endonuclease/exonuclease/phosphatase family metal-dependent hydrolase
MRRCALDVQLEWVGRRIQVVATHLGLRPGERSRQARLLLERLEGSSVDLSALLGDLNEWQLWGGALGWLRRRFRDSRGPAPRTYPARLLLFALDRIWVRPADALLGVQAHRTRLARLASDHLPLKAFLTLPEVSAAPPQQDARQLGPRTVAGCERR